MKHYTEQIWEGAYDAWCDYIGQFVTRPTYAEVFDELMEKGVRIEIVEGESNIIKSTFWLYGIRRGGTNQICGRIFYSWYETANHAIKNAIEYLKSKEL